MTQLCVIVRHNKKKEKVKKKEQRRELTGQPLTKQSAHRH
jgi:hypothetical protein